MKRALALIIVTVLLAATVACAGPAGSGSAPQASSATEKAAEAAEGAEGEKLNIFFTSAFVTVPYAAPMNKSMNEYAQQNNINLQIVDGEGNSQKQLDQIKNAVTQGVDGIIYWPADVASTIPVVNYLADCGVPFVVLNSKVDQSVQDKVKAYVGLDYEMAGGISGGIAAEYLKDGGKVAVVEGVMGTEAQIGYLKGFKDAIASNPKIEIIATQAADWDPAKAMKITEDYLTTFKDGIDLIYSEDDGMYQGIASALADAGKAGTIKAVCNGQMQFVLDSIEDGTLLGASSQDPMVEGRLGIETMTKILRGETVPEWTKVDCKTISKENVGEFSGW